MMIKSSHIGLSSTEMCRVYSTIFNITHKDSLLMRTVIRRR